MHSDNANKHMLIMVRVPLFIILLVVYQYMSVSYIVLPENGLMSILSNKYHRGGAPWWRALSVHFGLACGRDYGYSVCGL